MYFVAVFRFQKANAYTDPTLRLQVNNLGGTDYWTNKGDTQIYPGNPRTVAVSVEVGL